MKRNLRSRLLYCTAFVAFLAAPSVVCATTYYVDNSIAASSDSNPGTTQDKPWKTLAKVSAQKFLPGDTIEFKAGTTYTGGLVIKSSGNANTAKGSITFTAYGTGAKPIISNTGVYHSYTDAVQLIGASYIVMSGLEFTTAAQSGVNIDSNSNYNTFTNNEATDVGIGFKVGGQHNFFSQNYMHDLKMVVNDVGGNNDYGANGFVISNMNNEFANNECLRCAAQSYDYGTDGGMFELYGTVDNTYIHDNLSLDTEGFIEVGAGTVATANNVRIQYNVSNNNGGFATVHFGGQFSITSASIDFSHNTIVEMQANMPGALNYIDVPPAGSSVTFHDNIVALNTVGSVFKNEVTSRYNNLYYFMSPNTHMLTNWGNTLGSGEIKANPQFVNLAGNDFHLTATSPAIKQAKPSPTNAVDMDNAAVPANTVTDIGAYTYKSPAAVSGKCGTASTNRLLVSVAPTPEQMCSSGVAISVASTPTSYTWYCDGLNGGKGSNCAVNKAN